MKSWIPFVQNALVVILASTAIAMAVLTLLVLGPLLVIGLL